MKRTTICAQPGCPNIAPCDLHSRPANAPWSKDRDHKKHLALRRYLITTRGPACERCGWTTRRDGKGLQMHHVRASDTPDAVILLCQTCHRQLDAHAR